MKKVIVIVLLVIAAVWGGLRMSAPRGAGPEGADLSSLNSAKEPVVAVEGDAEERDEVGPASRFAEFAPPSGNGGENSEVAAQIYESFEISKKMSDYLDDGKDELALQEARGLVNHSNSEVRWDALNTMIWIGAPAIMDMVSFVGDPDPAIEQAADEAFWDALDEIDDPVLKIQMLQIPLSSSDSEQRMTALDELLYLPGQLTFAEMAKFLGDANPEVSALAQENLAFIAEEEFLSEAQAMAWYSTHKESLDSSDDF